MFEFFHFRKNIRAEREVPGFGFGDVFLAEVSAGAGGSSQVMETVGSFYGVGYGILADAGDIVLHVITFFFGEQFYRLQDFFTSDGSDLVFGGICVFQKIVKQSNDLVLDILALFLQNNGYRHRR